MAANSSRRGFLLAAGAAALTLTACGGGDDTVSNFRPTRVIVFGDGFADIGEQGRRFTVNDNTANIWTQQVASFYGVPLTTRAIGGLSYASGSARVSATPDASGSTVTRTVEQQISDFLAVNSVTANDLVLVNAGTADVIAEVQTALAGRQSGAQAVANTRAAGRALGAQVRRLVNAGAKYVAVAGPYDMGKSIWAIQTGQASLLGEASSKFNEDLLVSMVDLGNHVLYIDAALQFNLMIGTPAAYSLVNVNEPACTSIDPGTGIGTGAGQVSSARCTPSTLRPGIDGGRFLFADRVYPTPQGHRLFGEYAYSKIRDRW